MTRARRVCLLLAILVQGSASKAADDSLQDSFDQDVLVIVASQHACYRFDVYLAISNAQQRRGLMHVRELPDRSGMLFVYKKAGLLSMWMKNTYIPLDISFARADGSITNIVRDTEPLSLKSISATEPVTYVLELNAGITKRLNIDSASRLLWGPALSVEQ